ncbi:hypothetical protein ACRALDRAFT_2016400 [Sodiomyces alcalophilus JCM 7366]|uniref:uncharacterized protein n=1 Tax=Sodiomyces alcalophilus JCM 7366 TaxID=591952 RepID=UPI0039B65D19
MPARFDGKDTRENQAASIRRNRSSALNCLTVVVMPYRLLLLDYGMDMSNYATATDSISSFDNRDKTIEPLPHIMIFLAIYARDLLITSSLLLTH